MKTLTHKFIKFIPDKLDEGILYVSVDYCTAVHKCICGCGNEVVTPISPTDWKLTFDGKSISLDPSIGNWSFDCKSHYWIINNKVYYARKWSDEEIFKGRANDAKVKRKYYNKERKKRKFWLWLDSILIVHKRKTH
jgi:hypothetical protein